MYPDNDVHRITRVVYSVDNDEEIQHQERMYLSFEDAFLDYERMYKMDKLLYKTAIVKHNGCNHYEDASYHYDKYTFLVNNHLLSVSLDTAIDVADKLFGFDT